MTLLKDLIHIPTTRSADDFVVKPRFSCSGRGVAFFPKSAPLPARDEPCVVQAMVDGAVLSTFSVVRGG